jgi:hypothetical protein|tara:strand:- start:2431 stop:3261 length:831 start_codon:yes stop_codon:yes gene_type:complete
MRVSEAKTIDTLVEDIYQLVTEGKKKPNQEALFAMGSAVMEAVRRQLWMATSDMPPKLRMSNIGKACSRQLWYDINGDEKAEKFTPETKLKFMVGDIVEALLIYLSKEAGHAVTEQQASVELDGIVGHIDCVIDDELVDIKSASSFAMKKFKNGTLPNDDPFGYISQISGYGNAMGKKRGTFLAFDKSSGEMATYTHPELEDSSLKIKQIKAAVSSKAPPDRCFDLVVDRQTSREKLGINCSYCSHKQTCWEELDIKFRSGRPVFFVGKSANAHSF